MESPTPENDALEEGLGLIRAGDLAKAKEFFVGRLAAGGPSQSLPHFYLSLIYNQEGDAEETARQLELAIGLDPGFVQARESLMALLFNLGRWAEALPQAEALLALEPASISRLESAAYIHRQLGQTDQAKELLAKALALAPERLDLAAALAGFAGGEWSSPWPDIDPKSAGPFQLSKLYHKFWAGSPSPAMEVSVLKALGRLEDPAMELGEEKATDKAAEKADEDEIYPFAKDLSAIKALKGLSIFFGPPIIAGVSARMAKIMKAHGAKAETYDVMPSYLDYKADHRNEDRTLGGMGRFTQFMLQQALKSDIICVDFACSLTHFPTLGYDFRSDNAKVIPYADLFFLKQQNKKIFCVFWGSDCYSQSYLHHCYLKLLGITNMPTPLFQTRSQQQLLVVLDKVADALIAPPYFVTNLPRTVPFWDLSLEPEMWPEKKAYNKQIDRILTAPTSKRKKNYSILEANIKQLSAKYNKNFQFSVQNKPYKDVPAFYAMADLGLEQATNSFGLLTIEMMATGLPVITNFNEKPCGSPRSVAPIVSYGSVKGLNDALEGFISDPSQLASIGKRNRDYALTYHGAELQCCALSRYFSQAASGGPIDQVASGSYARYQEVFRKDPSEVIEFLYYDIAVPIFCMLGEYDYAMMDCQEAVDNRYNPDKFTAIEFAILHKTNKLVYEQKLKQYTDANKKVNMSLVYEYNEILTSSKKLLDEASTWMRKYEEKAKQMG